MQGLDSIEKANPRKVALLKTKFATLHPVYVHWCSELEFTFR